jgi:uncharacterized protein (DUF1697 family)
MPTFVALLRGVNVGGNMLRMERLRELCAELGGKDVRTYVQSGNVIFAAAGSAAQWSTALARKLAGETRLAATVIVKTPAELGKVVDGNPFLREKGTDAARLYVTFLERAPNPAKAAIETLDALAARAGSERLALVGKEVHLYVPNGYGRSKLSNSAIEKALGLRATTRNWNTVNKLLALSAE